MNTAVYAGYTQAQLDAQYNNQTAWPGFKDILAEAARRSHHARLEVVAPDVRWGDDARESLDIYGRAEGAPRPVVVFIHGGAWLSLDKESSAFAAPAITAAGPLFVALGFHTAATVSFATMVDRVRAGMAWLVQNIHRYGGDPGRIVLVGHSSGTHLVTQCLTHDWTAHGLDARPYAGAVLVSGLCDLEPVRLSYRNERLALTPDDVLTYSLKHQPVRAPCPVDVLVAERDTDEFRRQSAEMASILRSRGVLRDSGTIDDRNHFDVILDLATPGTRVWRSVISLADPARG